MTNKAGRTPLQPLRKIVSYVHEPVEHLGQSKQSDDMPETYQVYI